MTSPIRKELIVFDDQNTTPPDAAALADAGHIGCHDLSADGSTTKQSEGAEAYRSAVASELPVAKEAVPETSSPNEAAKEVGGGEEQDEAEEEPPFDDYDEVQEDEETREYMPLFIKEMLENPPVPPGISVSEFQTVFQSFERDFKPPHRPKTDLEYYTVWRATVATCRLNWLDRLMPAAVQKQQRSAVESMHLQLQAVVPSSKKAKHELKRHAKEKAMDYFADPDYRKDFASQLNRGGFSVDSVQVEAFQLAIPSLTQIERMRKSANRELDEACKQLDRAYASRNPDQRMPLSMAAERNFYLQVQADKELARQERELERAKKATEDGNPQADRGE